MMRQGDDDGKQPDIDDTATALDSVLIVVHTNTDQILRRAGVPAATTAAARIQMSQLIQG